MLLSFYILIYNIFIVHIKSSLTLRRSFPHEYIVLLTAKLQISNFSTKKKKKSFDEYIKQ